MKGRISPRLRRARPREGSRREARALRAIALLALALAAAPSLAGEEGPPGFSLGGSIESRAFAACALANDDSDPVFGYGSASTLSLELRAQSGGDDGMVRAEASFEASILSGMAATMSDPALSARMRTLYVKAAKGPFSAQAGRQVVNFGSGKLWRPSDLFDELDLSALSPSRLGADALRLNAALGETGELALVGVPTADPGLGRYALRARLSPGGSDIGLVAAREGGRASWVAGADARIDLGVSLYADAVCEIPDGLLLSGEGEASARAAAGADWSAPVGESGRLLFEGEYYYNGSGALADPLFPGSHNAYASAAWSVDEYLGLSLSCLWAPGEGSLKATASAAWNLAQGAALKAYARAAIADGSGAFDGGASLSLYF
jgi:hypothetical protein